MEAIPPDFIFLIIFIWQTVHICLIRHGLVKCRVEYRSHGRIRHQFPAGIDANQVCRIVQGRKVIARFYRRKHLTVDQRRLRKFFTTVHNTVSNGSNFAKTLYYTCFFICQRVQYQTNGICVAAHGRFFFLFFTAVRRIRNPASFYADSLTKTFCNQLFIVCIDKLEL